MCGRYALYTHPDRLAEQFRVQAIPDLKPRYNIAPSQSVPGVRSASQGRELVMLHWGLLPAWAKQEKTTYSTINARAETVADKPAFRAAFRQRRCLIPADGFYEWRSSPRGKQPHYIGLQDGKAFAFAGLWERWQGEETQLIESCTIIVTTANTLIQPIHERMPVILEPADYSAWLDVERFNASRLQALLKPYPPERMRTYAVSKVVNNPKYDTEECITPLPA